MVRLVGGDAVGRGQSAVDDHVIALAQAGQSLVQARRPRRENVQGLADVPSSDGGRDAESGCQGGQRLVLHRERRSRLRA
jgi:hypothetical protein